MRMRCHSRRCLKERELYQLNIHSILEELKCLTQMRIHCPERYGLELVKDLVAVKLR